MASKRLEEAAQAAGFAMVNPEDFAGEAAPVFQVREPQAHEPTKPTAQKSWLSWDYMRLTGGKATA